MGGLRLRLLREFVLERDSAPIGLPLGAQRLLAFLAVKGPALRCFVAGTMWPEVPEPQALANLRTAIWRLNQISPDSIICDGPRLEVTPNMVIDSQEQERFTTRLLRESVENDQWITARLEFLWTGELLPGWYDDWVLFDRERLNQLRLHALEYVAALMSRRNDLTAALQCALEAVRTEPLRETANARLIEVYMAEGNVCDALRQYETFRLLLDREFGLEPSPNLSRLLPTLVLR